MSPSAPPDRFNPHFASASVAQSLAKQAETIDRIMLTGLEQNAAVRAYDYLASFHKDKPFARDRVMKSDPNISCRVGRHVGRDIQRRLIAQHQSGARMRQRAKIDKANAHSSRIAALIKEGRDASLLTGHLKVEKESATIDR